MTDSCLHSSSTCLLALLAILRPPIAQRSLPRPRAIQWQGRKQGAPSTEPGRAPAPSRPESSNAGSDQGRASELKSAVTMPCDGAVQPTPLRPRLLRTFRGRRVGPISCGSTGPERPAAHPVSNYRPRPGLARPAKVGGGEVAVSVKVGPAVTRERIRAGRRERCSSPAGRRGTPVRRSPPRRSSRRGPHPPPRIGRRRWRTERFSRGKIPRQGGGSR